jgi:hypothetical protein
MDGDRLVFKLSKTLWKKSIDSTRNTNNNNDKKLKRSNSLENSPDEKPLKTKLSTSPYLLKGSSMSSNSIYGNSAVNIIDTHHNKDNNNNNMLNSKHRGKLRPYDRISINSKTDSLDNKLQTGKVLLYLRQLSKDLLIYDKDNYYNKDIDINQLAGAIGNMLNHQQTLKHLTNLRLEHIIRLVRPVLQKIMHHSRNHLGIFNRPVDPLLLNLPDYFKRIKHPMDLGTVRSKLQLGEYENIASCFSDIILVFKNAMTYNEATNNYHILAKTLRLEVENEMTALQERSSKETLRKFEHSCHRCIGSCCSLCGEKCLKFEPPTIMCYGTCNQKIKRSQIYFVTVDGLMTWCSKCYTGLPQVIVQPNDDTPRLIKKNLLKRKCDEEPVETWVKCDICNNVMHQICALYNDNIQGIVDKINNNGEKSRFECPLCRLETRIEEKNPNKGKIVKKEKDLELVVNNYSTRDKRGTKSYLPIATATNPYAKIHIPRKNSNPIGSCIINKISPTPLPMRSILATSVVSISSSSSSINSSKSNDGKSPCDNSNSESEPGDDENLNSDKMKIVEENNINNNIDFENIIKLNDDSVTKMNVDNHPIDYNINKTNADVDADYLLKWNAKNLPETKLSTFLENMVANRLKTMGLHDIIDTITIRMPSNDDRHMEVPDAIINNMMTSDGNCIPKYLEYRQKCILMFQKIDGVDICLFCLYVQEFGESCPAPNKSVVYIAYLDSVDYFRPVEARTVVYHEILVAYLAWVRARGFKIGHIWSCPPQRGDNFIFWCHPPHQRTPSRERLSAWYSSILQRSSHLGILDSVGTIWNSYFSSIRTTQYNHTLEDNVKYRNYQQNMSAPRSSSVPTTPRFNTSNILATSQLSSSLSAPSTENTNKDQNNMDNNSNFTNNAEKPKIYSSFLLETVPISPPLFDGDFWVSESLRCHKLIKNKSKSINGLEPSLNQRKVREILKQLMSKPISIAFNVPVNSQLLNIPEYHNIIKHPMDLDTIRDKLRNNMYKDIRQFAEDVRLTFRNATTFNPVGHIIYINATTLLQEFETLLFDLTEEFIGEIAETECVDDYIINYPLCDPIALVTPRGKTAKMLDNFDGSSCNDNNSNNLSTNSCTESSSRRGSSNSMSMSESNIQFKPHYLCTDGNVLVNQGQNQEIKNDDSSPRLRFASDYTDNNDNDENSSTSSDDKINDNESTDFRRSDSMASESNNDPSNMWSRRQYSDRSGKCKLIPGQIVESQANKLFEKPELGFRGAAAMLTELKKSVQRLKDDLFVVKFAPILNNNLTPPNSGSLSNSNSNSNIQSLFETDTTVGSSVSMSVSSNSLINSDDKDDTVDNNTETTNMYDNEIDEIITNKEKEILIKNEVIVNVDVVDTEIKTEGSVVEMAAKIEEKIDNIAELKRSEVSNVESTIETNFNVETIIETAMNEDKIEINTKIEEESNENGMLAKESIEIMATNENEEIISQNAIDSDNNVTSHCNTTNTIVRSVSNGSTESISSSITSKAKSITKESLREGLTIVTSNNNLPTVSSNIINATVTPSSTRSERSNSKTDLDEVNFVDKDKDKNKKPISNVSSNLPELGPPISAYCDSLLVEIIPDTSDPDSIMSSPFADSRHTFLEMCQYRHYQFDSLRRSKHSSLMLLYHLFNPHDKNSEVLGLQCPNCNDIIRGIRWHCDTCPSYDICSSCHDNQKEYHPHVLTPHRVSFL